MRASLALAVSAAIACLAAPTAAQVKRFRSSTDAVRVDALVLDGRRPVGGLTPDDFELQDAGVAQQIDDLQTVDVPFSMLLALDASSSMQPGLRKLQEAARGAVEALRANDRASALIFSEAVRTPTPWSSSRQPVLDAIAAIHTDGSTSLVDAAFSAIMQRDPEPGRRNLVILFTDGTDTSSWLPDAAAIDLAERSDVVVYCIGIDRQAEDTRRILQFRSGIRLTPQQPIMRSQDFLQDLALRTGGEYLATNLGALEKTFRRIVDDFSSRYVLAYRPQGVPDGGWHPIDLRVKNKHYKVTARRGYQR